MKKEIALLKMNTHWMCYMVCLAGARYQALLIPDCPGALSDLAHSGSLARILAHFTSQQSEYYGLGFPEPRQYITVMLWLLNSLSV